MSVLLGTDGMWRLSAAGAPWRDIASRVESASGVRISGYDDGSEEIVSIQCTVPTVESMIECLAGPGAEVIFVYGGESTAPEGAGRMPTEAYIATPAATQHSSPLLAHDTTSLALEHQPPDLQAAATPRAGSMAPRKRAAREDVDLAASDDGGQSGANEDRSVVSLAARRSSVAAVFLADSAMHSSDIVVRAGTLAQLDFDPGSVELMRDALRDADDGVRVIAQTKLELAKELAQRVALDAGSSGGGGLRGRR